MSIPAVRLKGTRRWDMGGLLLFLLVLYFIVGNFARLVGVEGVSSSLNVIEIGLAGSACLAFVARIRTYIRYGARFLWMVAALFAYTMMVGIANYSLDFVAIGYAVRFAALIVVGFVSGIAVAERFDVDAKRVGDRVVLLGVLGATAGFLVLYLFPDSTGLWSALSEHGINFNGDPHKGRLVGAFFDPNYYSVMAALPFLLSMAFYLETERTIYLIAGGGLFVSLVLAGSRSGMASVILPAAFFAISATAAGIRDGRMRKGTVKGLLGGVAIALVVVAVNFDQVDELYKRSVGLADVDSTENRMRSFEIGLDLIEEKALSGHGYNFVHEVLSERKGNTSLDSSVQMIAVSFGLPLSCVIMWRLWHYLVGCYQISRKNRQGYPFLARIGDAYTMYLVSSFLVVSNFNNIFFYPYWIVMVTTIGAYIFAFDIREVSRSCCGKGDERRDSSFSESRLKRGEIVGWGRAAAGENNG